MAKENSSNRKWMIKEEILEQIKLKISKRKGKVMIKSEID